MVKKQTMVTQWIRYAIIDHNGSFAGAKVPAAITDMCSAPYMFRSLEDAQAFLQEEFGDTDRLFIKKVKVAHVFE